MLFVSLDERVVLLLLYVAYHSDPQNIDVLVHTKIRECCIYDVKLVIFFCFAGIHYILKSYLLPPGGMVCVRRSFCILPVLPFLSGPEAGTQAGSSAGCEEGESMHLILCY